MNNQTSKREIEGVSLREENNQKYFHGYAFRWNTPVLVSEYGKTFYESFAKGSARSFIDRGDVVELRIRHHDYDVLASTDSGTLTLKEDETGLYWEAPVNQTTAARDAEIQVSQKLYRGSSIQFAYGLTKFQSKKIGAREHREITELGGVDEISLARLAVHKTSSVSLREEEVSTELRLQLAEKMWQGE